MFQGVFVLQDYNQILEFDSILFYFFPYKLVNNSLDVEILCSFE
jgi:hypothetical protein